MTNSQSSYRSYSLILLILVSLKLSANEAFNFSDIENMPPEPPSFQKMSSPDKIKWLRKKLGSTNDAMTEYRYKATLIRQLYFDAKRSEAETLCRSLKVLKRDFSTRAVCIELLFPEPQDYVTAITEIIEDAKEADNHDMVGNLLGRRAWRKSENGDIAGAFLDYETALNTVSPDNTQLVSEITFDTASSYIVHGNDYYIRKGIDLLTELRKSKREELKTDLPQNRRDYLKLEIQISYFNTGIAYTLHLHDYEKALAAFEKATELENSLRVSAASYSAFVAAKLGYYEKSKAYLKQIDGQSTGRPIVDKYLNCYRELAKQYWERTNKPISCLQLDENTPIEDRLDIYKRLSDNPDEEMALYGLKQLKTLFVNNLEPKLRNSGTQAATNTEVTRLEKESELKSLVLTQQKQLQAEVAAKHANEKQFFIALFLFLLFFILFVVSQLRQKKKLAEQFQKMSIRDPLTKLGNRRFLEQQIQRELAFVERAIANKELNALGVFIFDVDHFKKVNDTHGHGVGDEVLIEISKRVNSIVRDCDLLIRWGGEEFVLVARLSSKKKKYELASRLLNSVNASPFIVSEGKLSLEVTCTIGVVEFPFIDFSNTEIWPRLISIADAALYYGKSQGRNCWIAVNNKSVASEEEFQTLLNQPLEHSIQKGLVSVRTSLESDN